jgi:ABC-type microcin C transport system permease subunit YejB
MGRYVLRRSLLAIPVVLGVVTIRSRSARAHVGGREPLLPPTPPNGVTI